jgi:hypothetical protein
LKGGCMIVLQGEGASKIPTKAETHEAYA